MDEIKKYHIFYTLTAEEDIIAKAEYIKKAYRDAHLAYIWYTRLRTQIEKDLSFFPYKYQLYSAGKWMERGIREYILRNDIVLYSIDEQSSSVMIHALFTRGKNIAEDILDNEEEKYPGYRDDVHNSGARHGNFQ